MATQVQTQRILQALRAAERGATAHRLAQALDTGVGAVTGALWALKAAGLATNFRMGPETPPTWVARIDHPKRFPTNRHPGGFVFGGRR